MILILIKGTRVLKVQLLQNTILEISFNIDFLEMSQIHGKDSAKECGRLSTRKLTPKRNTIFTHKTFN